MPSNPCSGDDYGLFGDFFWRARELISALALIGRMAYLMLRGRGCLRRALSELFTQLVGMKVDDVVSEVGIEEVIDFLVKESLRLSSSAELAAKVQTEAASQKLNLIVSEVEPFQKSSEGQFGFRRLFPLDVLLIILKSLELEDQKAYSLVSSQANDIITPLLFQHFSISWTEQKPISDLYLNIRALTRRKARARAVQTLTMFVGWKWNSELQSEVDSLLSSLPNLSSLRIRVPDVPRATVGGELGPVAQMLYDHRSQFDLDEFWWDHILFWSSPLIDFIKSQKNLTMLRAPRNLNNVLIRSASEIFANLETLIVNSAQIAEALVPLCPRLKHLKLIKGDDYMPLNFPIPWILPSLYSLEISFQTCMQSWTTCATQVATACPNLNTLYFESCDTCNLDLSAFQSLETFGSLARSERYLMERRALVYPASLRHVVSEFPRSHWSRQEDDTWHEEYTGATTEDPKPATEAEAVPHEHLFDHEAGVIHLQVLIEKPGLILTPVQWHRLR